MTEKGAMGLIVQRLAVALKSAEIMRRYAHTQAETADYPKAY